MSRPRPLAQLHAALGTPGLMIGVLALLSFASGLVAAARGYHRFRDTGREALRGVLSEWVRITPVDDLSQTLKDYADRWQQASPAAREALAPVLRQRLGELGLELVQPGGSEPLIAVVSMDLRTDLGAPLAHWPAAEGPSAPDPLAFRDRIPVLAGREGRDGLVLDVRYRLATVVEHAAADLEATYHRLWLAILGLAGYSLLCLAYMVGHARALSERVGREAAQEATLDLADRTCHELGNVVFVLANERRNLDNHLDLLDRFLSQEGPARAAAARRAGLGDDQAAKLDHALARELAERGIEPSMELAASASLARAVCDQVAVCSEYIALTVRELDAYLKRSALPVTPEPVAVAACLDDALALLRPRLEGAGAVVDRPEGADGLAVVADRRLLVHALVNLLKNAQEASTGAGLPVRIRLGAWAEGATGWISVADSGPGIPASSLPKVFDLGYSTKGTGRGRGLATVRESVDALGGELQVASGPGPGTEFRIGLPRSDNGGATVDGG